MCPLTLDFPRALALNSILRYQDVAVIAAGVEKTASYEGILLL